MAGETRMNPIIIICFVSAVGLACGYYYCGCRMIRERKDRGQTELLNPLNICFYPFLLTQQGLRARKWFFACGIGFLLSILVIALMWSLTTR